MKSEYIIQSAYGTSCPICTETVDLLCNENGLEGKPCFYICWACSLMSQVGVGTVDRSKE